MHLPVLTKEVIAFLSPRPGGVYVDGCLGAGGYAEAILEASGPDGRLFGFDIDEGALEKVQTRLQSFGNRFTCLHAGYHEAQSVLKSLGVQEVNGIVVDLGLSSDQLDDPLRGFSFRFAGPLDMRFDRTAGNSALDLLGNMSRDELAMIIREYGEEHRAAKIAKRIKETLKDGSLKTTQDLANIVSKAVGGKRGKIHPATRVFQALRISVNNELGNLEKGLAELPELLSSHGRFVVVSYHSLEDRMVKKSFRERSRQSSNWQVLTPKPQRPSREELRENPRSRSAKLRVIEAP